MLAMGEAWLLLAQPHKSTDVYMPVSVERLPKCANHLRRKQGCCPEKALSFSAQLTNCNFATCWYIQLSISQDTQPSPSFIQHLIRAIGRKTRILSGKSFVFLCAADKLQCWHIELSRHSLLQLSFIGKIVSVFYQCHLKITLGPNH